MVVVSFEMGMPNHPANKNVVLWLTPATGKLPLRQIVHFFGGQGTINVNSWSLDSTRFAYVSYELLK